MVRWFFISFHHYWGVPASWRKICWKHLGHLCKQHKVGDIHHASFQSSLALQDLESIKNSTESEHILYFQCPKRLVSHKHVWLFPMSAVKEPMIECPSLHPAVGAPHLNNQMAQAISHGTSGENIHTGLKRVCWFMNVLWCVSFVALVVANDIYFKFQEQIGSAESVVEVAHWSLQLDTCLTN